MLGAERVTKIIDILNERGSVKIDELADKFRVSSMTIRRDLEKCRRMGLIHRCYGGAISKDEVIGESEYNEKISSHKKDKKKIAAYCARLVHTGDSVYLDAGTTSLAIAEALCDTPNISVITNDLRIALLLSSRRVSVTMLGGIVQPSTFSAIGSLTVDQLRDIHVDIAFVGVSSINDDFEVTTPTSEKVFVKRAINESADKTYLVTDFSKFHKQALHRINNLSDFTGVITTGAKFTEEEKSRITDSKINMIAV